MREREGGDMAFGAESLMHISAIVDSHARFKSERKRATCYVLLKNHWTRCRDTLHHLVEHARQKIQLSFP